MQMLLMGASLTLFGVAVTALAFAAATRPDGGKQNGRGENKNENSNE
jgi:hypothetical protein